MESTHLQIGIVGLPNVGKSTLFNAILKRQVALAANYPFATIEPNVGVVEVPDERVDVLSKLSSSAKNVYSQIEFYDIAGLVEGASKGEGLGNKFLTHIRDVDLILLMVRSFEDSNIVREGSKNPKDDADVLLTELMLKDIETLTNALNSRKKVNSDKKAKAEAVVLEKALALLNNNQLVSQGEYSEEEMEIIKQFSPLTLKPILYLLNVSEEEVSTPSVDIIVRENFPYQPAMTVSAKIESELSALSIEDQKEYLKDLGLDQSPLDAVIKRAYEMLGLRTFLTTGAPESRAWKFRDGWNAVQCAGVIHTDFMKKFINAQVVDYASFVELGGWKQCKEKGKVRQEGRDYMMKDGDIVEFMIGK